MEFSNPPLDLTGVPRLDDTDFVPLDPAFLRVSLLQHGAFAAAVVVAGIVVGITASWFALLAAAGVLVLVGLSAAHSVLNVRHIAWQVRAHDLSYRSGVLVRSIQTLPFVRIQHARITRGPIERKFGLAKLHVSSAGPNLAIHGLAIDDAERLRTIVIERAGDLIEQP